MKNFILIVIGLFSMAALASCGDSGDGGGSNLISPSDANALSSAITIEGATRMQGQPPAQGGGTGAAPTVTGGGALMITSGDTAEIEIGFESESGYQNCYVQVDGADEYFVISEDSEITSGTITIEVEIPDTIDTGAFDFYTCIAGANGAVSNPVNTPVGVTNPGGNPGGNDGFVCASDNPELETGLLECPGGAAIDFCIRENLSECYYQVGGQRFNCSGCEDGSGLQSCAESAVQACI